MSRKKRKTKSKSKRELLREGLNYFKSENYSEASKSLEKASKKTKERGIRRLAAEACFRKALSLYETGGRINYVISELHRAIKDNPKTIYHYHLGLAYHRKGRTDKAIPYYLKAIKGEKDNDRFKYHLSLAYLDQDNVEEANATLEKVSASGQSNVNLISDQMEAVTLLKQGDYQKALEALQDFDDEYAIFLKGVAYIYLENRRDAKSSLRLAIKKGFGEAIAHYHLGVAYAMSGNLFSATKSWEAAIKANSEDITQLVKPDLMNVYRELAAEYVLKKDALPKAVSIWKKMLKIEPENPIAKQNLVRFYFLKANDYVEQDKLNRAISNWENVIELEPNNTDALHNIALAYDKKRRTYDATEYWEKVVKIWKKDLKRAREEEKEQIKKQLTVAYRHLGNIYSDVGQIGNAVKYLHNVVIYDSEDIDVRVHLASLYVHMGQTSRAVREMKHALKLKPENVELYNMLAMIYAEDGKTKQAINFLLDAYQIIPKNEMIYKSLSFYTNELVEDYMVDGKAYRAIELLKNVIESLSDDAELHALLGEIYLKEDDIDNAQKLFQKAIDIDPDDGYTYALIGKYYLIEYEKKIAESFFKKALNVDDTNLSVLLEIGKSYCLIKKSRKAKKYFDLAIKYNPSEETFSDIIISLVEMGSTKMVKKYIQEAIDVVSQPVPVVILGVMSFLENDDFEQVDEYLELATKLAHESDDPRMIEMVRELEIALNFSSMLFGDMFDDEWDDDDDDDEWGWI